MDQDIDDLDDQRVEDDDPAEQGGQQVNQGLLVVAAKPSVPDSGV